jgi:Arc/MetJ family transcription regulator
MRTTVNIDPKLLAKAEQILHERGTTNVVNAALRDVVRRQKLRELRQLIGKMQIEDRWREDEERELADMEANRH